MKRPAPKHVKTECSVCGQDWAKHEELAKKAKRKNPNLDDCVSLLKAALASRPAQPFYFQGASSTANPLHLRGVPLSPNMIVGNYQ